MVTARRAPRSRPVVAVLALLSVTLIVLDQFGDHGPLHGVQSVVRDGSTSIGAGAGKLWPFGDSAEVKQLQVQNQSLRAQLDQANGKLNQMPDAVKERDNLAALLHMATPNNVPRIVARVDAVDTANFDATIRLDRGTDDGVQVGMPVVTGAGLVGRVSQATGKRSSVRLIDDSTSNVSVRFSDARDVGVAVGTGAGDPLRVDLIDLDSTVQVGEVAVTSGLNNSIYPAGIPVGTVKSSTAGAQDLRRDVRLNPVVNLAQLSDVAVLQWLPSS